MTVRDVLTADNLVVTGLFALLVYVVVSDVRRPGFSPTWYLYLGLLAAMLVVMGYSIDSQWFSAGRRGDDSE
ncbi:hypothetical protein [Halomarina rubra]|uniref:Uncharacterized protein n=1 Tax=Halomarina rubra TaxID=2071873 RepID=A0ABD6B1K7_9EURY|nr:hypothetical protein [Halomarina rubra]